MMGAEQRPNRVREIGGIAEITGLEIPTHDIFDILTLRSRPFTIFSSRTNPERGHEIPLSYYFGDRGKFFVWMTNNDIRRALPDESIVDGLFRVDRQNRRLLFEPHAGLPTRDRYRAAELHLGYKGTLIDMAEILVDKGFSVVQISMLRELEALAPSDHLLKVVGKVAQATRVFKQLTGLEGSEAYQIEGPRTLEQIIAGQFLPVTPINLQDEGYLERLRSEWLA